MDSLSIKRLKTEVAKKLAEEIIATESVSGCF